MNYIKFFAHIMPDDTQQVGAKIISLSIIRNALHTVGIQGADGFAVTADAYHAFLHYNDLHRAITDIYNGLHASEDIAQVQQVGHAIRLLFMHAQWPPALSHALITAYQQLCARSGAVSVAVRSSATAEDLPDASFAGQQETYLHIQGEQELLTAIQHCFASLFTDRALVYRAQKNFDWNSIALCVAVQCMVESDTAVSGVAFSLDTESGFNGLITINASYGLGQTIVGGQVVPDEYLVSKRGLSQQYAIIKKSCGSKKFYAHVSDKKVITSPVLQERQKQFCLTDGQIDEVARVVAAIELYYCQEFNAAYAVDVEWAYDASGKLYVLQIRPETVHAHKPAQQTQYCLITTPSHALLAGASVGQHIVHGTVKIIETIQESACINPGDIIVTNMTDPDWVPALQKAAGLVTQMGGRTCHAAIVSRELGIPALVGASDAMKILKTGMQITLDCSQGAQGYIYGGFLEFKTTVMAAQTDIAPVSVMLNLADPNRAFTVCTLPVAGVGLARIEFIIASTIKIHPLALLFPDQLDECTRNQVAELTAAYTTPADFFIQSLAQGIATIATAFFPRPVIVRLSDFKSNEYRSLLGGSFFEPEEENPMLGVRGAFRYYSTFFKHAFALECAALTLVREKMGLTNVKIMVPFVRTLGEAHTILDLLAQQGLRQKEKGLEIIMMCEIPSNVIMIDEFLTLFDGISIGSNDLTQLTLGVDRDSAILSHFFNEQDPIMKKMFALAIAGAKRAGKYSGICGQAPSDYPELAEYLIACGIDTISLNHDSVIPFLQRYVSKQLMSSPSNHLIATP